MLYSTLFTVSIFILLRRKG
ncbi:sortase B protein-sorting domain-containing protein [Desulfitobacterium sp. PCE1]